MNKILTRLMGLKAAQASDRRAMSYEELIASIRSGRGLSYDVGPEASRKDVVVYRCVALIAGHFSQTPLRAYDEQPSGELVPVYDDPVLKMVNHQPSYRWTAATFWDWMIGSILLYGDAFAVIETTNGLRPLALRPYHPRNVEPMANGPRNVYRVSARLPNQPASATGVKQAREVLHLPNLLFDGERSCSNLSAAGNALGYKRAMDEFSKAFYAGGLQSDYALSVPEQLTNEQLMQVKAHVEQTAHGTENSRTPLVLSKDTVFHKLSITPRDAFLLELTDFRSKEIRQAFGIPNAMMNEDPKTAGVAKAVSEMVDFFVRTTLAPIAMRIQQELERKLAPTNEMRRYRFDWDHLLKANMQARFAAYSSALGGQSWLSVNDIRRREGLPAIDDPAYDRPSMAPGTPGGGPGLPADPSGDDEGDANVFRLQR